MNETMTRPTLQIAMVLAATLLAPLPLIFQWGQGWLNLLISAPVAVVLSFAVTAVLVRRDTGYLMRMGAVGEPGWDVWINGVAVGRVSDAEYASMQRRTLRDGRILAQQVVNVAMVWLRAAGLLWTAIPLGVFWGGLMMAAFFPESFAELAQAAHQANAATMASATRALLQMTLGVTLLTLMVMAFLGVRFGFRNCYAQAVHQALRVRLGVAAGGEVEVRRDVPNAFVADVDAKVPAEAARD